MKFIAKLSTGAFVACTLIYGGVASHAVAQDKVVNAFGEKPGVDGTAKSTITVEDGNFATLIAVGQVSGGKPVGEGMLTRAGIGVDVYVDEKLCTADRDIRRSIDVKEFKGEFATSATCMTVLGPGEHSVLAEKTNVNVEGSKMVLKYSVMGGKPERLTPSANE